MMISEREKQDDPRLLDASAEMCNEIAEIPIQPAEAE
jgi:hypothetical protein